MIGSLRGTVAYLGQDYCLLETPGGVGYRVFMPSSHLAQLILNKDVRVLTHTAVREDAILLYGFLSQEYYSLFELLLGVSGVGPKMALGILSAIKPDDFYLAIQSKDMKVLVKLPGIGKKTAERMLLELKDKVGSLGSASSVGMAAGGGSALVVGSEVMDEAVSALTMLGFVAAPSQKVVAAILRDNPAATVEQVIKEALKRL